MAGLHAGVFGEKFKCSICQANKKMPRVWGCEKDSTLPESARCEEENGIRYIYSHCLVRFIPMSIYRFIQVYDYYCKFTGAAMPAFSDVSRRFLSAYNYYESKLNQYKQEMLKNG